MPGPCRTHGNAIDKACDACILWSVETHRIMVEALDMADEVLAKHDWPTLF